MDFLGSTHLWPPLLVSAPDHDFCLCPPWLLRFFHLSFTERDHHPTCSSPVVSVLVVQFAHSFLVLLLRCLLPALQFPESQVSSALPWYCRWNLTCNLCNPTWYLIISLTPSASFSVNYWLRKTSTYLFLSPQSLTERYLYTKNWKYLRQPPADTHLHLQNIINTYLDRVCKWVQPHLLHAVKFEFEKIRIWNSWHYYVRSDSRSNTWKQSPLWTLVEWSSKTRRFLLPTLYSCM